MSNIVAIVGRPNVGKSTLFNRLTGEQHAIMHESSGVTRDRHYGKVDWNGVEFSIIDTGGYVLNSDDVFEEEIRKQVVLAIEEADNIIFVVDVEIGANDMDYAVADLLRRSKKNVFLAVNKVDNNARILDATEFYNLGLGEYHCISSINGSGTGELLDAIVEKVDKSIPLVDDPDIPRIAIVGRPNVGKSSLINALVGEERNIVTPVSGTTRDTINTRYNKFGYDFYLMDTAGMRKRAKVHDDVEFYSVMRSIRAIESADVCILMLDATQGFESQDMSIIRLIQNNSKGIVILVNKWDLIEKETETTNVFKKEILSKLEPFDDVEIIFVSALTKQRIHRALEAAVEVYNNKQRRIPTSKLNEVMQEEIERNPPPAVKGKWVKIKYITQLPSKTPSFAFFCNLPQYVKDPYKRYIENKLRRHFNFTGVPINIFFRQK